VPVAFWAIFQRAAARGRHRRRPCPTIKRGRADRGLTGRLRRDWAGSSSNIERIIVIDAAE
jgi:hypothetical protein